MYRHDPGRTAAGEEQLGEELHVQWSRQHPQLVPSWLGEYPHLRFDANYEPIVMGKTLYFGSSDDDSVTALDTGTGEMRWRFFANGPVRLAPVAWEGKIYFGADDGVCYCLDAEEGTLLWKFDTALSGRKGFVEGRLGTICPIRGGPVLVEGKVHFVAGIWSWEESAFLTLDAATGEQIHLQKGVRSQGYLTAVGPSLYAPNGRATAVRLNRETGMYAGGVAGWAGYWDHLVTADGDWVTRMGSLQKLGEAPTGLVCEAGPGKTAICFFRPVIADDVIYYSAAKSVIPRHDMPGPEVGDLVACSLKEPTLVEAKDADGKPILTRQGKPETKLLLKELWRLPNAEIAKALGEDPSETKERSLVIVEIKAGNRLYGYRGSTLFAVDLPSADGPARVSWKASVEGTPARMLAADGKLFAVTREGRFYCFGQQKVTPKTYPLEESVLAKVEDEWSQKAGTILDRTTAREGYCLVLGLQSGRLVEELFRRTRMHIIAMDEDPKLVRSLRERLSYLRDPSQTQEQQRELVDGTPLIMAGSAETDPRRRRVAILEGNPASYPFPPYMAGLIVSEDAKVLSNDASGIKKLFGALRPYGGTACLGLPDAEHASFAKAVADSRLANADVARTGDLTVLWRVGSLEGSDDWTHEWADAANTLKSDDHLEMPLGMLWTGGLSARRSMYFDRHVWPPSPVVMDGRMFLAGPDRLVAVDVYTGRILWEVRSDAFTSMTRGNGGCHTVGASDAVYVSTRKSILCFDPTTGRLLSEFGLPADCAKGDMWGRSRVWENALITSIVSKRHDTRLIALNRQSGAVLWQIKADSSFSFVAMGNEKIFCWDGSQLDLTALKATRRGGPAPPIPGRLLRAFDARNGKELWRTKTDSVVDWLSYSEEFDVLVASTKKRIHAYCGRDGRELWHKFSEGIGFRGHPGNVWQKVVLWHDWIIDQRGPGLAYDLRTGKQVERPHPVTFKPVPWEFIRQGHHCNHAIGSENFLTFRAGNATFVDLTTLGTGTFPGIRTGCTNSLVVANGVLNSPMYAHLCSCGYEFFSPLAFTHMPEVETWTYRPNQVDFLGQSDLGRVQRLGINLGGQGERRSPNGTLWFGVASPMRQGYALAGIPATIKGGRRFQVPTADVESPELNWIFAVGMTDVTSLSVPLSADKNVAEQSYTVRLYFMEPSESKPGERVFSVKLQNQEVLKDFDIAAAAGGPMRGIIREFKGIKAGASLEVAFTPTKSAAAICGIEVLNEAAGSVPPEAHNRVVAAPVGKAVPLALFYRDVDGPGPHTFRITKPPTKGSLSGYGPDFTYTAKPGTTGEDTFAWVVNDGQTDSREAVVTIKLLAPNVPPKAQSLEVHATTGIPANVVVPFNDPDQQPGNNRFEVVRKPAHGTVRWQGYDRFLYTPSAGYLGTDSFTWKLNDGQDDSNVATVTLQVKPDTESPAVAWVDSAGPNDGIKVVFSEPVAKGDAEKAVNYAIGNGAVVQNATLGDDGKSVTLGTSELKEGVAYTLTVDGIRDRAAAPNAIDAGTKIPFAYVFVGNGLWAQYYEGTDFRGKLIGERIDPYIEVDWRKELPFPNMKPEAPYCVRWTGRLKAEHTEQYMLYFFKGWEHNRNPARVWVDGKLLANEEYGPISLEAGKTYDLKVELSIARPTPYADYYSLRWSSQSTPKETIPQANLGVVRP